MAIEFQGDGGARWAELTGQAACQPAGDPRRRVAIVLDRQVISSPQVDPSVACQEGIGGGQTVITGDFGGDEAQDLALLIRAGALPVPVEVVEQRTVGPTLGEAAISASVQAAVAGAALTVYGLLSFAVLPAMRSTLTLPGIAGFVLAIGMAVDALFHQAGVIRTDTLDELFEVASLLANQPIPAGRRVDVAALEDVLPRVSAMVEAHPEIAELDCNR